MKGHRLQPYKMTVAHALKEHDLVGRINFCNWFLWSIHDGEVDTQLVFSSSDAWFSLHEEVNFRTVSMGVWERRKPKTSS
jgi:hypothetical protein